MLRPPIFWVVALGLSGCSPEAAWVPLQEGDIAVALRHSGSDIRSTVVVAAPGASEVTHDRDESLAVYRIARDSVSTLEGGYLPEGFIPSVRTNVELGSCPCVAPEGSPQVIRPGERCPIPSSAEELTGDPDAEGLRNHFVLEWPGDCACSISSPRVLNKDGDRLSLLDPPFEPTFVRRKGDQIVVGSPAGVVMGDTVFESEPGELIGVSTQFPGGFVWVRHRIDAGEYDQEIEVRYDDGRRSTLPTRLRVMDLIADDDDFLAVGTFGSRRPAALLCEDPELQRCTNLLIPAIGAVDESIQRVDRYPTGEVVMTGGPGLLLFESLPKAGEVRDIRVLDRADGAEGAVGVVEDTSGRLHRFRLVLNVASQIGSPNVISAGLGRDYLAACGGYAADHPLGAALIIAKRPADLFTNPRSSTRASYVQWVGGLCGDIMWSEGNLVAMADGWRWVCDEVKCTSLPHDHPPFLAQREGLASALDGSWLEISGERVSVLLPAARSRARVAAIVPVDSDFYVFKGDGELVKTDGSTTSVYRLSVPGPVTAAAFDTSSREIVVAGGRRSDCTSWFARLNPETPELRMLGLELSDVDLCTPVLEMAESSPGTFILLAERALLRLRGEKLEQIEIDPDDPLTAEHETELKACQNAQDKGGDSEAVVWKDLAAREGAAFAVGCQVLVRVNLLSNPPKAERVAVNPNEYGGMGAVDLSCGSSAGVGVGMYTPDAVGIGRLLGLRARSFERTSAGFLEAELLVEPANQATRQSPFSGVGSPRELLGFPNPVMVFAYRTHWVGARHSSSFVNQGDTSAAAIGPNGALIGTDWGHMLFFDRP